MLSWCWTPNHWSSNRHAQPLKACSTLKLLTKVQVIHLSRCLRRKFTACVPGNGTKVQNNLTQYTIFRCNTYYWITVHSCRWMWSNIRVWQTEILWVILFYHVRSVINSSPPDEERWIWYAQGISVQNEKVAGWPTFHTTYQHYRNPSCKVRGQRTIVNVARSTLVTTDEEQYTISPYLIWISGKLHSWKSELIQRRSWERRHRHHYFKGTNV